MADGKMSQEDIDAMLAALSGDAPVVIPAGTPAPPVVPSEDDIARMAKDAVGAPTLGDKQVVNQQEIDAVMAEVDTEMLRGSTPPAATALDIKGNGSIDQADLDDLLQALDQTAPPVKPVKPATAVQKAQPVASTATSAASMGQDDIDALLAQMSDTPVAAVAAKPPAPANDGMMGQDDIDALLAQMTDPPVAVVAAKPPAPANDGMMGQDDIDALLAQMSDTPVAAVAAKVPTPAPANDAPMGQDDIDALLAQMSETPVAAVAAKVPAPTPANDGPMGQDDIDALLAQMGGDATPSPASKPAVAAAKPAPAPAGGQLGQDDIDAMLAQMTGESPVAASTPAPVAAVDDIMSGPLDQAKIDSLLAQLGAGTAIKGAKPKAPPPAPTPVIDPRHAATQPLPQVQAASNAMTMALSSEDLASLVAKHADGDAKPSSDTMIAQADIDALVQQLANANGGDEATNQALGQALAKHEAAIDQLLGDAVPSSDEPADAVAGHGTGVVAAKANATAQGAHGPSRSSSPAGGWHGPVMAPPEIKGARWLLMAAVLLLGICAATLVAVTSAVHRLTGELKAERVAQLTADSGEFADDYQSALALLEDSNEERRAKGELFLGKLKTRYPAHAQEISLVLARHYRVRQAWRPSAKEFAEVIEGARRLLDDPRIYLEYSEVLEHIGDQPGALRAVYLPLANEAVYTGERDIRRALRPAREAAANRVTIQECQLLLGRLLGERGGTSVATAVPAGHAPEVHAGAHHEGGH